MYARTVDGETLSFGVSGMLWRENLIMYDRQSESWWSQADGVAIHGPKRGSRLVQLPADMMSWRQWRALYPATRVLAPPRGTSGGDQYARYHASRAVGVTGRLRSGGALDAKVRVLGVRVNGRPYAIPLERLAERTFVQTTVEGRSLVMVGSGDGVGARAFLAGDRRFVDARLVNGRPRLSDAEGLEWDGLTGQAVGGGAGVAALEPLAAHVSYWFSWHSFFPDTTILGGGTGQ